MISFFPKKTETRLVELSPAQLDQHFEKYIKPIKQDHNVEYPGRYLFNGVWSMEGFSISLMLKISNNFVPVINGEIIPSDEGILIKMTYNLFPSTKRLLLFWTVLTLLITLFFVGIYQAWLYGAISFGFCIVNYILTWENFKIQVRKSRRMLEKMLS